MKFDQDKDNTKGEINSSPENKVENSDLKILRDTRENGKENDWKGHKRKNLLMAEHMYHASDKYEDERWRKKAKRMEDCCKVLMFKLTDKGLRLDKAYTCKDRLCSMCNWRRSRKMTIQNYRIIEKANQEHKLRWVFLTLTQRNCQGSELKEQIDRMMKAWNRFIGYRKIDRAVKGYFRALEITKDWDECITKKRYYTNPKYYKRLGLKPGDPNPNYKTYHPHFHVLMCVPPSYFSKHKYIKQKEWQAFWKRAMQLDYDPIVDVRTVKPKKEAPDLDKIEEEIKEAVKEMKEVKAIKEVSKYPMKDTDVLPADHLTEDGIETAYTMGNAIYRRKLIGYGGILEGIRKELQLDDAEDGDLVRLGDEDETANAICEVMAYWHPGIKDYVICDKPIYQVKDKLVDSETGEIL